MGRSPVWRTTSVRVRRPTLASIGSASSRYSPGFITCSHSLNRVVYRDQFRAVGKCCFHLHLVDHFGDAGHYVGGVQDPGAERHDLRHRLPVPRPLQNIGGQYGDRFGVVQLQPACAPLARHIGGNVYQEPFLFAWGQMHSISYLSFLGGTGASPVRKRRAALQKLASVAGIRCAEVLSPFTTTPSEASALVPHIVHPWRDSRTAISDSCRSSAIRSAAGLPIWIA